MMGCWLVSGLVVLVLGGQATLGMEVFWKSSPMIDVVEATSWWNLAL